MDLEISEFVKKSINFFSVSYKAQLLFRECDPLSGAKKQNMFIPVGETMVKKRKKKDFYTKYFF